MDEKARELLRRFRTSLDQATAAGIAEVARERAEQVKFAEQQRRVELLSMTSTGKAILADEEKEARSRAQPPSDPAISPEKREKYLSYTATGRAILAEEKAARGVH